jgi:hypothetical protein
MDANAIFIFRSFRIVAPSVWLVISTAPRPEWFRAKRKDSPASPLAYSEPSARSRGIGAPARAPFRRGSSRLMTGTPPLRPQGVGSGRTVVAKLECRHRVESRCGAVAVGRTYLFAAPFVWRCLSGSTLAPFPHPAHRTGRADFPHPALGQDLTPSPTTRRAQAGSDVRARSARKDARVDSSRPCSA